MSGHSYCSTNLTIDEYIQEIDGRTAYIESPDGHRVDTDHPYTVINLLTTKGTFVLRNPRTGRNRHAKRIFIAAT